jgi:hypothetical protein
MSARFPLIAGGLRRNRSLRSPARPPCREFRQGTSGTVTSCALAWRRANPHTRRPLRGGAIGIPRRTGIDGALAGPAVPAPTHRQPRCTPADKPLEYKPNFAGVAAGALDAAAAAAAASNAPV